MIGLDTIGLTIHESELIDLTELGYGDRWRGMYPSAGGSGKKKKKKRKKRGGGDHLKGEKDNSRTHSLSCLIR
jgi:hypothetical protein